MIISLIVAMAENRAIGLAGDLPWRLSADLKRFKRLTMGHHLVLGRKTYQSLGRPLPGRRIIVLTRDSSFQAPDCQVASSLEAALELAREAGESELFIGGGGGVYDLALPMADRLYLTQVHARVEGDTFFPPFDPAAWRVVQEERLPADDRNQHPTTFQVLVRQ